ncbi:MAG: SMP-30/gluconolactonase/LRE family protein [Myxococcota bacterium]
MNLKRTAVLLLALIACGDSDAPLLADYPLVGDALHPEGIAFDGAERRFLFGSLTEGTVFALDASGEQRVFADAPADAGASFGLAVDDARRALWICTQPVGEGADSIRRYDLDTAQLRAVFALSDAAEGAQCNDLVASRSGDVFITDPAAPRIYRIAGDVLSVFVEDERLAPTIAGLGTNGIALSEDEATLFVAYFSPAQIFAVPVQAPSELAPLSFSGDAFAGISVLSGPDGLVVDGNVLIAVFDDAVLRITLDASGAAGVVASVPLNGLTGLSTAAIAEGELYVSKSEVFAQVLGQAPELPFRVVQIAN